MRYNLNIAIDFKIKEQISILAAKGIKVETLDFVHQVKVYHNRIEEYKYKALGVVVKQENVLLDTVFAKEVVEPLKLKLVNHIKSEI